MLLRKKSMYEEIGRGTCNNKAYYEALGLVLIHMKLTFF